MECLHATGPREPCQILGGIEACSLESSTRFPYLAFMSMVAQVHNPSRLTPHGTGSKSGEAMHRSAYSYIRALLREGIHYITDAGSGWQTMMTFRTQGLFCSKPQTVMADCRTCHKRCKRKRLIKL